MKLVVINKLSDQWISELQSSVPGAIVESYPSPKEALPYISDADAIAMWGFQDVEPVLNVTVSMTEQLPSIQWHFSSVYPDRFRKPSASKTLKHGNDQKAFQFIRKQ